MQINKSCSGFSKAHFSLGYSIVKWKALTKIKYQISKYKSGMVKRYIFNIGVCILDIKLLEPILYF